MKIETDFNKRDDFGNYDSNLYFLNKLSCFSKDLRIIEIGSGRGRLLASLIKEGFNVTGIEIDQSRIDKSYELFGDLPIIWMSGDDLKFDNASFDCVISFDVFEHIKDTDKHIKEVKRILKPGGYYLLQTPNKWTNSIFETIRWKSFSAWKKEHCSLHNYWELKKRFAKQNFSIEFYNIPIVTDFFLRKMKNYLGFYSPALIKIFNPDRLPVPLKTNFYVKATKYS